MPYWEQNSHQVIIANIKYFCSTQTEHDNVFGREHKNNFPTIYIVPKKYMARGRERDFDEIKYR